MTSLNEFPVKWTTWLMTVPEYKVSTGIGRGAVVIAPVTNKFWSSSASLS
jgi:hypothetical protein